MSHRSPAFEATIAYFAEVAAATDLPFYGYWLGDIGNNDANQFLEAMKHVENFAVRVGWEVMFTVSAEAPLISWFRCFATILTV